MPSEPRPAGLPAHLPYPTAPNYLCGDYRGWSLHHKPTETTERGYFSGVGAEPPGYYLENQGNVWMSTSRLERESHAVHVDRAHGTVVVCGVGMGLYLFNVAGRPEVDRVVAVDRDGSTIDLVERGTGFDDWPGRDKVRFVQKDALALTADDLGGHPVDYLYVDIWPELGDPVAVPQTQAIQAAVRAAAVGWWGEELDFVEWVFHHRPPGHVPTADDRRAFAAEIGMPLGESSAEYVAACRLAADVYAPHGSLAFAAASRGEPG